MTSSFHQEMKRARKARRKAKQQSKSLPKINLDDYDMPADDGQADLVEDDESEGHLSDSGKYWHRRMYPGQATVLACEAHSHLGAAWIFAEKVHSNQLDTVCRRCNAILR